MNSESKTFIDSLVNTVNDLNKFGLSMDYKKIRPDITASHVISVRGQTLAGAPVLAMKVKETEKQIDKPSTSSKDLESLDETFDISHYLDSGTPSAGNEHPNPSDETEAPEAPETARRLDNSPSVEFVEYNVQDDSEFYLDPRNPRELSPTGIAQIWREINTISNR